MRARETVTSRLLGSWLTILLTSFPVWAADSLPRPYYGATIEGSWAKYSVDYGNVEITQIYRRLEDADGRIRIEFEIQPPANATGMQVNYNVYTLSPDFPLAQEGTNFGSWVEGFTLRTGETVREEDGPNLENTKAARIVALTFEARGQEEIDGRQCDHFGYVEVSKYFHSTDNGELWLDDSVPFGVVKKVARVVRGDGQGEPSVYTMTLLEHGGGPSTEKADAEEETASEGAPTETREEAEERVPLKATGSARIGRN